MLYKNSLIHDKKSLRLKCTRLGGKSWQIFALKLYNMQITFLDGFLFEGM